MAAPQMIFVNLPVKSVDASKAFFEKLGYSSNPQFSDETTACVVFSDTIFAMLLEEPKFKSFMAPGKELSDATRATEVLVTLSAESREKCDELADAALAAAWAPRRRSRWTSASCTAAPSPTWTATTGRSSGWTRRPPRAEPRAGQAETPPSITRSVPTTEPAASDAR